MEVAAIGERLGEDRGVGSRRELAPDALEIALLPVHGREALAVEVDADHPRRELSGALDLGDAQGVDPLDAGQGADALDGLGRDAQVGAARHLGRRADVEVADERPFEPDLDGGAEAADHHRDADRDGDRERQGGDRDAGARDRRRDGARAHPAEEADRGVEAPPAPRHGGDGAHADGEGARHEQREADQDEKEAAERERKRSGRQGEDEAAGEAEEKSESDRAPGEPPGPALELGAQERRPRRGVGGLERRRQRGGERRAEAQQAAFQERERREREVAGGEREVEVADRLQHEPHEPPAEHDAHQQPERAADDAEHGGLGEDEGQDLAAPDAQGAQASEELAALDDREGHRVVDQEGAAQQGQERQGAQVETERPRHLLERFGSRGGARQMDAGRQERRDLPAGAFARFALGQGEIDAGEPPRQIENLLRGRDVDQRQVRERLAGGGVGRLQDSDQEEPFLSRPDADGEAVADFEPEPLGGRALEERGAGGGEKAGEVLAGGERSSEVAAERRLAPRIEAEKAQDGGGAGDRAAVAPPLPLRIPPVARERRNPRRPARRRAQPGISSVPMRTRAKSASSKPFESPVIWSVAAPAVAFGRHREGAPGALVGEIDRHHDGDPQRHAGERQPELGGMAQVIAAAGAPEKAQAGLSTASVVRPPAPASVPGRAMATARPADRDRG